MILELKTWYSGLALYFARLPAYNGIRALLMHHAVVRHWLASRQLKSVDEWISAVMGWGVVAGNKLVHDYWQQSGSVTMPGYPYDIEIRSDCSDRSVFRHILIYSSYALKVPSKDVKWVIDAGANVGFSALYFALRYPQARIIAVEPDIGNYQQLLLNTRYCNRIRALHAALWCEKIILSIADPNANTQAFQVVPDRHGTIQGFAIPDIMSAEGIETLDILKMDIEGAEKFIFESGYEEWIRKVRIMIVELHDKESFNRFHRAVAGQPYDCLEYGENVFLFRRQD